jgi:adenylate cyclase
MPKDKTIAVLPFINMSASQENEFFSDGITEEIINALAKIGNLKVTSRTSSFFFKGKSLPITEIGNKLGVSTILEGSVRVAGNALRITAQLIQVEEDFHFWSDTWDRKLENIFEIQDEISLLIADKLREHFGHLEIDDHLVSKKTESIKAYECCLKGRFYENKWNPEDVNTAIAFYEKALEFDSEYAEAYTGLAGSYSFLGNTGFLPFEEAWGKTIAFTKQAYQYDNQSSWVYYHLSNEAFFIECDYAKSLRHMQKAIELNPNNADAQQFISFLYIIAGKRAESNAHLDIALSINPLSEETLFFRAYFQYMIEDYPKSLEMLDNCLAANDKNIPAHSIKTLCLLQLGRYEEVIQYFEYIPADVIIEGEKTGSVALAHALKGDQKMMAIFLEKLNTQANAPNGFTADSFLFLLYGTSGQNDKAFEWAEDAFKKKSSLVMLRFTDPIVSPIRKDHRYEILLKKIYQTEDIENVAKQKNALLDEATSAEYSKRLLDHLSEHKSYLKPELSLRSLAQELDIHPNQLSWLLNQHIGKNFNEFINHSRVELFKSISKDPKNGHLTIEGLAYECGFNSKTVFNTYFKQETGLTPSQFLKNQ